MKIHFKIINITKNCPDLIEKLEKDKIGCETYIMNKEKIFKLAKLFKDDSEFLKNEKKHE